MKRVLFAAVLLSACPPEKPTGPDFALVSENIAGGALLGAHGDGDEVVFVGGDVDGGKGLILHYSKTSLCVERDLPDRTVWWIHGDSDGEWYAVGDGGLILHEKDGVRTDESVATESTLYGVYKKGERVFAVGGDVFDTGLGEVWLRENGEWTLFAGDLPEVIFKVWEQWFVGQNVAYELDGDTLVKNSPTFENETDLTTVVGRSATDVYTVGGDGGAAFFHNDGSAWERIDVDGRCSFQHLNGVWTATGEDVFVGGFFGAVARYDGSEWHCPDERITQDDFHVVYKHKDEVLFGGGNLFTQSGNHGVIARFGEGDAQALSVVDCPQ